MKNIRKQLSGRVLLTILFLNLPMVFSLSSYILPSLQGGAGGGSFLGGSSLLRAQDVSVLVNPVSPVLPPLAGDYLDNPGKFFTVKLVNNSDEQQLVHMGMHIDMLFPDQDVLMATPANDHIPRQPIVLSPQQSKILNPIEMKNLFSHFTLDEIGLREDVYEKSKNDIVGLLPEGQYEVYLQAYKWDPELTQPVQLNKPDDGHCQFSICYKAQPPQFLSPVANINTDDPLGMLAVAKLDMNNLVQVFTWTPPTLGCNSSLVSFYYDLKVVKLDDLMPDEALDRNPVEYQASRLTTPTFTLPVAYYNMWKKDTTTVYAMQVTAHSMMENSSYSLNFSLLENEGKSNVLLFRFYEPLPDSVATNSSLSIEVDDGAVKPDSDSIMYTFQQPTLTKPVFNQKFARKSYVGDSIVVDWRKAWFAGGKGEKQDTVKFEYTVNLYKANSADTPEAVFATKPIYSNKIGTDAKALSDTIKWDKLKDKVQSGDYLMLRVTASSPNEKSLRMLGDSLNYKDFAMTEHFDETYACGLNTSLLDNKKLIEKVPDKDTKITIGDWILELNEDVKIDDKEHTLSGTGWIGWAPGGMYTRVAVKFENLKVNTDNVVIDGKCVTYPEDKKNTNNEYSAEQALDSLFSSFGLDNVWGDLSLPEGVKDKVSDVVGGEAVNLAEQYDLGKYYTYFKQGQNQWEKWKKGDVFDFHCPTSLPDTIASLLPDDVSVQIASMQFSPQGAVMDLIGEFVLPKSDVLDNDLLIFGMPRMCISQKQFLPEDGTLALLSNFTIKDPESSYRMTFKAPTDPLNATDGCFIRWEDNEYSGLSIDIAMTIPNLKRVVDGNATDEPPLLELHGIIEDNWGDWMARIHMDPFEVEDLPGWTFSPGQDIIFDHSYEENYQGQSFHFPDIAQMPKTYDPSKVNSYCKNDWNAWQGIYVNEISVQFPKWAVFGNGDEGLKIAGQKMFFDNSGVTCDIAALNILNAETAKAGGWEFDLDQAKVMITQNNFDSCHIEGRFAVPLFGAKYREDNAKDEAKVDDKSNAGNQSKDDGADGKKKNPDQGKVRFSCDIRHLTEGETTYYTYDKDGKKVEHKKKTYGEKPRMAYLFKTQQVDSLDFSCFIADVQPIREQTYLVVAAEDKEDGTTKTFVELCMAGQINIADTNSTLNNIRSYAKKLPLKMDFKGIHFSKMRLANFSRDDMEEAQTMTKTFGADTMATKRIEAENKWETEHADRITLSENKEMALTSKCFLDMGEWSLSSPKKKIGPFSVGLDKFEFGFSGDKLSLDITGTLGLCDDKINTSVGIGITSKLTIPSDYTNISGYSLSDGDLEFKTIKLDCDFTALHLTGELNVEDGDDSGYAGTLDIELKGLFGVKCAGGYFEHKGTSKEEAEDGDKGDVDKNYALGYFTVDISSDAGIHFDPVVINRIAGGFYFNARPTKAGAEKKAEAQYGLIGVSFGLGLESSAGKETLSANVDLNVVYDKEGNNGKGCLTTFLFKGNVEALSGMVDAKVQLLYQNDDKDRFLSLDITVEATSDNLKGVVGEFMQKANAELERMQEQLDEFQANLEDEVKNFAADLPMPGMENFASDYDNKSDQDKHKEEEKKIKNEEAKQRAESNKPRAAEFNIPLQMKITWRENGEKKSPTRWHLYLGEPDEKKRCQFTLVDFKSKIVNVNIGANAYLCIGNELPGDGQLPPIPSVITEFLNGGSSQLNANASLDKAQRSRSAAIKALLPTGDNVKGGAMVGASAWGFIDVDLGLLYGSLNAIAGFDMALVNYGNTAFCTNLHRPMGKNGWYATGQFYAYLAAKFGLHIKLGKLIDKKIDIVDAGVGGVFECGMPSPTWIEGRARVKMRLLSGLVNIDRSFHFTCGERCEAFVGNALDGFNLFDYCNIASDSLGQGWSQAGAINVRDFNKAMFTTTASIGSQYRLVDPSDQKALADQTGYDAASLNLNAARTYVFDLNNDLSDSDSETYGSLAAELYEFDWSKGGSQWAGTVSSTITNCGYQSSTQTNWEMASKYYANKKFKSNSDYRNDDDMSWSRVNNLFHNQYRQYRVPVKIKEEAGGARGSRFHLTGVTLKPGCSYVLRLIGTAYEVENGEQVWPTMVASSKSGKLKEYRLRWVQNKFFFFNTAKEEQIVDVPVGGLEQYVALAYPAAPGGKLFNESADADEAHMTDIARPTIALNTDIEGKAYAEGSLTWQLRSRSVGSTAWKKTETIANKFVRDGQNFVNMQPEKAFSPYKTKSTDQNSNYEYNLQLLYTKPVAGSGVDCVQKLTAEEIFNAMTDFLRERNMYDGFAAQMGYTPEQAAAQYGYSTASIFVSLYAGMTFGDADAFQSALNTYYDQKGLTCQKDTTIILADLYMRGSDIPSWQNLGKAITYEVLQRAGLRSKSRVTRTEEYTYSMGQPLAYESPFVGVQPTERPTYSFAQQGFMNYSTDGDMRLMPGDKANRLLSPYAYFAYLSNTVFIGGRPINAYSFDDVPVRHACEPLSLYYNGVSTEGTSQIAGLNESTNDIATKMYGSWNKWYYNDLNEPRYPLPEGNGPEYDVTLANQNAKTSPAVPGYDKKNTDFPFHLSMGEMVKDFAAPYYMAETLCNKMKSIADELYDLYENSWSDDKLNNDSVNNKIKRWNNRHRGQYLTVESRGFRVKVPYYQFPLIFGDCFGHYDGNSAYDPNHMKTVDRSKRSFAYSFSSKLTGARNWSTVSCLVFQRLRGGHAFHVDPSWTYSSSNTFLGGMLRCYVDQDVFSATTALNAVTSLKAKAYRVNAYNMNTGQFEVRPSFGADAVEQEDVMNDVYMDLLNVGGSPVKSMSDWVSKVGQPTVTCNDEELESSFDDEKDK